MSTGWWAPWRRRDGRCRPAGTMWGCSKGSIVFCRTRKAAEIEAMFGVRLVCPIDEFNSGSPCQRRLAGH